MFEAACQGDAMERGVITLLFVGHWERGLISRFGVLVCESCQDPLVRLALVMCGFHAATY